MDLATREIMWNIPSSFKVVMYALFFLSVGMLFWGFYKKFQYITQGKGLKSLRGPEGLFAVKMNWGAFFYTIFFQGKVGRKKWVGFFHSLIFYGFVVLWIATDLVAIHYDTPFEVFKGTTYKVISFLADWAGIAMILGIVFAFKRRYIDRPDYLKSSKPRQELQMYFMLLFLVILGFFIEGLRIQGTGMPIGEASWAPVGWRIAQWVQAWGLPEPTVARMYQISWLIHMISTMAFVALIGHSKFSHIFIAPLTALVTPKRRGAVLRPMNFEDESAEYFGLKNSNELSQKQRLEMIACVECGRCTQSCPANLAGKPLDPKYIITKARDAMNGNTVPVDFWEEEKIYANDELDACTTCGACMEECPVNIEHVSLIMDLKRYKALTLGELPPAAADAVNNIRNNGNPWGISQDDRMKWAQDIEVPIAQEGEPIDYLYYVGCAGSYDAANQQVVKDTVSLLKKAGVSFAVMGKTEKCNGDPIRRFGDEYSFYEVAIENIAHMRKYSFHKVVTHCPHCLHTIGKEYAKFEEGSFQTIHHTELFAELIAAGKLKPEKEVAEEMSFHDPCYLGRHHGQYNAPRKVLNSIPGLKLKEMSDNKDRALCCGMGGGNMWYELPQGEHLSKNRLEHVAETKVNKLASACSYCLINFNSSKSQVKETEDLEVQDIASILARSVE